MHTSAQKNLSRLQVVCIVCGILGVLGILITHVTPQRTEQLFTAKNIATLLSVILILVLLFLLVRIPFLIKKFSKVLKFLLVSLLSIAAGTYLLLFLFVILFQDAFIEKNDIIYQPRSMTQAMASGLIKDGIEALSITTNDSTQLHGWLLKNQASEKSPLIIYFGGSSQEVSNMIPYFEQMDGWSVALVNYRGYGINAGQPSEAGLFQDAVLVYDTLSKRADIDPDRIVTMGWSLGTGVAVYLSEQRPVSGTILVSPFDSWAHLFQSRDFPLIPLSIIHSKYFIFNSISRAPVIQTPLLCLVGDKDTSELPFLSVELADRWGGEELVQIYKGEDHLLLFHENESWNDIRSFLMKLK